jgi:ABC-type glycerol-3-phosphate transport system permease component
MNLTKSSNQKPVFTIQSAASDKKSSPIITLLKGLGLLIIAGIFIGPYIWMVASAFKPRAEIFAHLNPVSWRTFIPLNPTFDNIRELWVEFEFWRPIWNSLWIAIVTVVIALLLNSMIAFALSRLKFKGRNFLFVIVLSTLLIPFEAIMVPMFLVVQRIGLDDTFPGIFLPWVVDAFIIFLLRQHFRELPDALQDAATIDGCTPFQIYWKIFLPNIRPALVSAGFIKFIYSWDAYIWPLIITRDPEKSVVAIAIARLFTDQDILWEYVFAGSFLATIPIALLFLFLQRYYIQGVATSGLK